MTSSPDDWLLARERGQPVDAPADEVERYEKLGDLIRDAPAGDPPADWQQHVLARLAASGSIAPAAERGRRARRRRATIAQISTAVMAAAILVLVIYPTRRGARTSTPTVSVVVREDGVVRRTTQAAVGAELEVTAHAVRAPREVRVYRDDSVLIARCRDTDTCTVVAGAPGRYRAVVITGAEAPSATGGLDVDVTAARAAGARVVQGVLIEVR